MSNTNKFRNGYFQAPNDIFELDLEWHEKLVYLYICRCGNNSEAYPSYNTIAKKCSISKRKVIDVVNALVQKGLIKRQHRKNNNDENQTNLYIIIDPATIDSAHNAPPSEHDAPSSAPDSSPSAEDAPNKELVFKELENKELDNNSRDQNSVVDHVNSKRIHFPDYEKMVYETIISNPILKQFELDQLEAITYFVDTYPEYIDESHPRLTYEQWDRARKEMLYVADLTRDFCLDVEDEMKMIQSYFETKFQEGCNYSVLHYTSGDLRSIRYYEVIH
ncbi:helix-turn-helix domain-containing protein [Metabacillus fastidiosus]|uniref:helix-turn-helix domain-containing protein n=1 Tax=Metabacillus fastidiosus TaxID=1458 RepID=UPI002E1AF730|nr:helix-turn-helix domain-containing protein [Metabacillus fastidiosus]